MNKIGSYDCCPKGYEANRNYTACFGKSIERRRKKEEKNKEQKRRATKEKKNNEQKKKKEVESRREKKNHRPSQQRNLYILNFFVSDINECFKDIATDCSSQSVCVNKIGSYECCPKGFEANQNYTACVGKSKKKNEEGTRQKRRKDEEKGMSFTISVCE